MSDNGKCRDTTGTETWKNFQALSGIRTHDLCDAGAVLSQLSYQRERFREFDCLIS